MRFDPQDPIWPNRDRFVLSNGHASMLLWSVLHLTGTQAVNADYETAWAARRLSLDDIRHFRQLGSKAPGHPEYHWVSGVETTTGPLGQGVATSVGMAIAEKWLANHYNRPGFEIFDYNIYAVCGDGCMMEGVGVGSGVAGRPSRPRQPLLDLRQQPHHDRRQHAASPSRRTSRPGSSVTAGTSCGSATPTTSTASSTPSTIFRKTKGRPTFIVLDSHIGYGSPHKQDTAAAHGEPLGEEEVRLAKRAYGWPEDAKFLVPDGVHEHFAAGIGARGAQARGQWTELFAAYRTKYPELATEIDLMQRRELPAGWDRNLPVFPADPKGIAGRDASGKVLNVLAQNIPWFLGGSADLGAVEQDHAEVRGRGRFRARHPGGKNLHFGIREHAMAAVVNGLSLSKLRAFGATFFIFSDYARPAIRLVGPDGAADDLRLHPRRDGRRRGRPDPPAGGAARFVARRFPAWSCCGPATPTRSSRRIATSCSCATSRPCWCCRASRCRHWIAANMRRRPAWRTAPTCSPTPRRQARGDPHRFRQRGQPLPWRPTRSCSPRASARAWSRCRRGIFSSTRHRSTGTACCRPT